VEPKEGLAVLAHKSYPFRKTYLFIGNITPTTVIKDRNAYEITFIDDCLTIKGFSITTYTTEDKIMCINLFGEHPNCDPDTNVYCLPEEKVGRELNELNFNLLLTNLKTYYLDCAYFVPDKKDLEYKKLQSISIQFNS
jgi:hypothetical protein